MQCCSETSLLLTLVPTEQIRNSRVAVTLPAVAVVPPCLRDLFRCTYCERICNPNFAPPAARPSAALCRRSPRSKTERRLMRQQPEDTEVGVITTVARERVFPNPLEVDQCHSVSYSFKCCHLNVFCTVSSFFSERDTNNLTNNTQQQRDSCFSKMFDSVSST